MTELLLELYSEEIPARMQVRAAEDLKDLVTKGLAEAGLEFERAAAYVTPRRLTLVVEGLPTRSDDKIEEKKGPKIGAPEQALAGFMKSNGLKDISEAEERETDKGTFYFVVNRVEGRDASEILPDLLSTAIKALSWPKSMTWAEGSFRWVRPLHRIIGIFDGNALAGALDLGDRRFLFGDTTFGHRFLSDGEPIQVAHFKDYVEKLRSAYVVLDHEERKAAILVQARAMAADRELVLREDEGLLNEVTGLVEWPNVLLGKIDEAFVDLPREVLETAMRTHQKYFSLETEAGKLAPYFLVVSNMEGDEALHRTIVSGNERVLRARLSDAKFFWDQDRQRSLQSRVGELDQVTFHAKLGNLGSKVDRMTSLAVTIAGAIGADKDRVRSAARLAKADLVTGMVGEFPELQGIMGGYYAEADGEHREVAQAIGEHYAPVGPNDACPSEKVSIAVALADKLDTLIAFWAIDEKPTGSKDPFALRRAALGVIRLIRENELRMGLSPIIAGHQSYFGNAKLESALLDFFADRLKVALREEGVRHDLIAAVFALGGEDDLVRLLAKVEALTRFLETEDGANLLTAQRRGLSILRKEVAKDGRDYTGDVDIELLDKYEESAFHHAVETAYQEVEDLMAKEDYAKAMDRLAALRAPVDAFFDEVTVNADDPALRENRLKMLSRLELVFLQVADFSLIEGGER